MEGWTRHDAYVAEKNQVNLAWCPKCMGLGRVEDKTCDVCNGRGFIRSALCPPMDDKEIEELEEEEEEDPTRGG